MEDCGRGNDTTSGDLGMTPAEMCCLPVENNEVADGGVRREEVEDGVERRYVSQMVVELVPHEVASDDAKARK